MTSLYQTYRELLDEYIAFPSISTDRSYADHMVATADRLVQHCQAHQMTTKVVTWYGNPIVLANYHHDDSLPTVLIYGHYDVQPADIDDGWTADPFVVREDETKLYARGIVDNKGQFLIHLVSLFKHIEAGDLQYNIKLMIEGDEETGSPLMPDFVRDYADELACDFVMISDGEGIGPHPTIELGFRGGFNAQLDISTAASDVHSGLFGGVAPSATHELATLISKLYDDNHRLTIDGFYDDVAPLTDDILTNNQNLPRDPAELRESNKFGALCHQPDYDINTCIGLMPTVQISGMSGWYHGAWRKNIVPAKATAKINVRLVADQEPRKHADLLRAWIAKNLPDYVSRELTVNDPYPASRIDQDDDAIRHTKKLMAEAYGQDCYFVFCGGGIPIVSLFQEYLDVTCVMASLGNEDCRMHGIDENFDIDRIHKSLSFSEAFLTTKMGS